MELTNEFRVGVPVERAWQVLTDVERIAPCMPGAQLQEVEGDEYRGIVKVKVGPITAQYKGAATFASLDEASHTAVLKAEGRETRGQGNASALITAILESADGGSGTRVTVITDLTVTGKVAQFGRGVLADVSAKLLDQFVSCLESSVLVPDGSSAGGASPPDADEQAALSESADDAAAASVPEPRPEPSGAPVQPVEPTAAVRRIDSPEPVPVDLAKAAGAPVVKRMAGPIVAVVALGWLLRVFLRRRKR
jgi:uncharacterized protein